MGGFRHLTHEEIVANDPPLSDIYDLVVEGFRLHGLGQYENPAKQGIHPRPSAFSHAMPAYLPTRDLAGTKLVSVFPDNPSRGLAATTGIIVMLDPATGVATDIVDARWVTSTRTAMASIATSRLLAGTNPVFGIVGATGACGSAHLSALNELCPGSRVLVNSRSRLRCEEVVDAYRGQNIHLIGGMDLEALVRECEVLVVCTSYLPQPIFRTDWLHAGHVVLNVHSRGWPSDVTHHVDTVVCDDRSQILDPANGITHLYPDIRPDFELGQVVAGLHPGRADGADVLFVVNYGLAIFDILVADYLLQRC